MRSCSCSACHCPSCRRNISFPGLFWSCKQCDEAGCSVLPPPEWTWPVVGETVPAGGKKKSFAIYTYIHFKAVKMLVIWYTCSAMTCNLDPAVALVNLSAVWIWEANSTRSNWLVLPDLSGSTRAKPLGQVFLSTRLTEKGKRQGEWALKVWEKGWDLRGLTLCLEVGLVGVHDLEVLCLGEPSPVLSGLHFWHFDLI